MKRTPNLWGIKHTVCACSLTASMMLAHAQGIGSEREKPNNKHQKAHSQRRPADIPRSVPRRHNQSKSHQDIRPEDTVELPRGFYSINGSGNNLENPDWGAAAQPVIRLTENGYIDGVSEPDDSRPSARLISNNIAAQEESITNSRGATDYLWQWGQFIDHDIIETPTVDPAEPFDISVPAGDIHFDPAGTGTATISLNRSLYEDDHDIREQVNEITAYIDGSMIYGSDEPRAFALRRLDGSGKLKTTESEHGDLLPYNVEGFPNAPSASPVFFLAGDVRANEQNALTAMHTLFVREHNHWAETFLEDNPDAGEEEIYQFARMIVIAEIQAITYREFLPVLLGRRALPSYRGYKEDVRADISNEFGAAAFRLGHSMLSPTLRRIDKKGEEIEAGHLSLADAFFNPALVEDEGIDSILRGLASQHCQELDNHVVDDVRNFLFGPPGSGGFDLVSLNIQRGRDHGIPDFNTVRKKLKLPTIKGFMKLTGNKHLARSLRKTYEDTSNIDLWMAGLSERKVRGSMLGATFQKILVDQFTRIRDGDRFYYKNHLPRSLVHMVEKQSLAKIIRRNTEIGRELSDNVFILKIQKTNPHRPQQRGRGRGRRR